MRGFIGFWAVVGMTSLWAAASPSTQNEARASQAVGARVPAFPGAEGAGMFATGGRGGTVVRVTNLNAHGPGSLAEAVSGPDRIVVFDVSGIIDLAREGKGGRIEVAYPNITIAGQTAPGEGICLRGGALQISAPNVIVRHVRSRRGYISEGEMGDAIAVKPKARGEATSATGQSPEEFEKIRIKKIERGRQVSVFTDIDDILIDHCSASWATDENLTMTHAGRSTVSYSIAAEGLDYANPQQTPPNHSEGGLWGSAAPDGRSSMHHMLFAHNRLRNPRTTAGADIPPVLTLYNSVVYNWSEYATHTGSQRVFLQWLANMYVPGPDTPAATRSIGFQFHGDPGARVFARGNVLEGSPAATADNRLAVGHNNKFKNMPAAEKAAMVVDQPFAELPPGLQTAGQALATVLDEAGATLPARDSVDARIVASVRHRTGRVIEKETDLPEADRWPDYRSLPPPPDFDGDGLPDFWETQFGLDPRNPADAASLGARGYANIEHYFNNTDPRALPGTSLRAPKPCACPTILAKHVGTRTGAAAFLPPKYVRSTGLGRLESRPSGQPRPWRDAIRDGKSVGQAQPKPVVMIAATLSRANAGAQRQGEWRVTRIGDVTAPLVVKYQIGGDAAPDRDFVPLTGSVTIPAGARSAPISLTPLGSASDNHVVILTLATGADGFHAGCPAQSLVVIRR